MLKVKNYLLAKRKISLIDKLLIPNGCTRIVGLAGPNPVECVERWVKKGFTHITVYEKEVDTYILQEKLLSKSHPHVNLVLGDILESPYMENVFYDLDLCCSIDKVSNLDKFQENFMITVCMRSNKKGNNREYIEEKFFELRGEKILTFPRGEGRTIKQEWFNEDGGKEIITDKGSYLTTTYRDTAPMIIFTKL